MNFSNSLRTPHGLREILAI